MRVIKIVLVLSIAFLGLLTIPGFTASIKPVMASYNPPPANKFHAPLSAMALVGFSGATPDVRGLNNSSSSPSSSAAASGQSSSLSIRTNALRFIRDNSSFPQSETAVAVDPSNSSHVVGGFNDARFFFCPPLPVECAGPNELFTVASLSGFTISVDGGKTVDKSSNLPDLSVGGVPLVPWGDPSIIPTVDGNFFYASLAFNRRSILFGNGVMIAKSNPNLFDPNVSCDTTNLNFSSNPCWTDVFISGSKQFPAFSLDDKDRIAVDRNPGSPYFGSVYLSWDHFLGDGTSYAYLARCDGNLTNCVMLSGGSQLVLSGTDRFVGWTTVLVDKSGNVDVAWCNFGTFLTLGPVSCRVSSSPPGGTGFGPAVDVLTYMGAGTMFPGATIVVGWATEQFRTAQGLISIAADNSPKSGNLYFTTQVCVSGHYYQFPSFLAPVAPDNPGLCGSSVVLFSRSNDGGATWSLPIALSRPAVNDQPFVTVDSVTGQLYVLYYTTQFDRFNHRIDVVAATSNNAGQNFHQIRVTSVSNEPDADPSMFNYIAPAGIGGAFTVPQYGDYFEGTATGGTLWVLFTANYIVERGTLQEDPFLIVLNQNG
jgi:hypothetical protein